MNIDKNIVNRALEAAGQERLTDKDIETDSSRWRLIKDTYLSLILSTLSKVVWTSQLKRVALYASEAENLSDYAYMYILPGDCAKVEGLKDQSEYIVEGIYLYTNTQDAVLIYVSNGATSDIHEEDDYPEYDEITFDAPLSEYLEYALASKIANKITGNLQLSQYLFQQAMLAEATAKKATLEAAHSKEMGEQWWGDMIGLSVEGK